ncbi:MAG: hypothetical protein FD187_2781 [bacterium]|nr:MAG: hypothetical protein FD142_1215 [bacterium]KAF0147480.1 MAG: hypothetical protein FD187_2781 [bacterium]KAF0166337.1 MAG: hypothetical protein FD158_2709 [bacterium]TXT16230.1 MAG: hypothetical protein FD132_2929 [bacterium]
MPALIRSIPLLFLLAGCGAETIGTAAVGAKTQADAARQAEETKAQVLNQLEAAAQLEKQRLEQAGAAGQP